MASPYSSLNGKLDQNHNQIVITHAPSHGMLPPLNQTSLGELTMKLRTKATSPLSFNTISFDGEESLVKPKQHHHTK